GEVTMRLVVGVTIGTVIVTGVCYTVSPDSLSNRFVCVAAICALPALLLVRLFFVRSIDENVFRRKTLVYGAGAQAEAITGLRRRADRRGFQLVGTVPARRAVKEDPGDSNVEPSIWDLAI